MTLDSFVERLGIIPTVLMIDVEGSEGNVLLGAEEVLSAWHPKVFMEVHPDVMIEANGSSRAELEFLLKRAGYTIAILPPDHDEHWVAIY